MFETREARRAFIKLHCKDHGTEGWIDLSKVEAIWENGIGAVVHTAEGEYDVRESVSEIMERIAQSNK